MASTCYMKISQEIDDSLEDLYSCIPYDLFIIELKYCYVLPHNLELCREIYCRTFRYPRHTILSEEHGSSALLSLFDDIDFSPDFFQTALIQEILSYAREVDRNPLTLGRKVKKLLVKMEVVVAEDEIDQLIDDFLNTDQLIDDSLNTDQLIDDSLNTFNFQPASTSSIQALKRVRVGDDEDSLLPSKKKRKVKDESSKKQCTICLEEFFDGEEVALMPCGHVFHDSCIVKWLETSHYCPLCRFQMPC